MEPGKVREVGEAVSIVAVLVTLVFLVLEIRENTAVVRTQSYGENITRRNDWRMQLAAEPELTRLFAEFDEGTLDATTLTLTERQQFVFVYGTMGSIHETAWFARSYGTLGEAEWARFEQMMCVQYDHSIEQGTWPFMDRVLSPDFRTFTEQTCV